MHKDNFRIHTFHIQKSLAISYFQSLKGISISIIGRNHVYFLCGISTAGHLPSRQTLLLACCRCNWYQGWLVNCHKKTTAAAMVVLISTPVSNVKSVNRRNSPQKTTTGDSNNEEEKPAIKKWFRLFSIFGLTAAYLHFACWPVRFWFSNRYNIFLRWQGRIEWSQWDITLQWEPKHPFIMLSPRLKTQKFQDFLHQSLYAPSPKRHFLPPLETCSSQTETFPITFTFFPISDIIHYSSGSLSKFFASGFLSINSDVFTPRSVLIMGSIRSCNLFERQQTN